MCVIECKFNEQQLNMNVQRWCHQRPKLVSQYTNNSTISIFMSIIFNKRGEFWHNKPLNPTQLLWNIRSRCSHPFILLYNGWQRNNNILFRIRIVLLQIYLIFIKVYGNSLHFHSLNKKETSVMCTLEKSLTFRILHIRVIYPKSLINNTIIKQPKTQFYT